MSTGGSNNESFSSDSGPKFFHSPTSEVPKAISEVSQEGELDDSNSPESLKKKGKKNHKTSLPSPPFSPRNPFARLFRPASMETNNTEESSASSRLASFFRGGRRDSYGSMGSDEAKPGRKSLFARKRSDVSSMSVDEEEEAHKTSNSSPERTRIPKAVNRSLQALKKNAITTNESYNDDDNDDPC